MPVTNPTGDVGLDLPSAGGEETFSRINATQTATLTSQTLRVVYFRARRSETIGKLLFTSAGTAAAATPTLVRGGVYSVGADWSLTALLASTANDTAIYATTSTEYLRDLTTTFDKVQGSWYAVGFLVVTAVAAPTCATFSVGTSVSSAGTNGRPRLGTAITGNADLPASVAVGSLVNTTSIPYALLLP